MLPLSLVYAAVGRERGEVAEVEDSAGGATPRSQEEQVVADDSALEEEDGASEVAPSSPTGSTSRVASVGQMNLEEDTKDQDAEEQAGEAKTEAVAAAAAAADDAPAEESS
eukprot:CAMPEP_0197580418 /NCGR_PEP_ID=MMETSP1326-20131121/4220_1 /TAXON_ID=1155430 /ORGANISM="Genus nov. species nov., Strain RCC2288" /LENGTH=110 /DNA_ID=CAMNT_0043144161 /DNA_START=26 /DNA_END=359 /DNA_ORIENTATION=+